MKEYTSPSVWVMQRSWVLRVGETNSNRNASWFGAKKRKIPHFCCQMLTFCHVPLVFQRHFKHWLWFLHRCRSGVPWPAEVSWLFESRGVLFRGAPDLVMGPSRNALRKVTPNFGTLRCVERIHVCRKICWVVFRAHTSLRHSCRI